MFVDCARVASNAELRWSGLLQCVPVCQSVGQAFRQGLFADAAQLARECWP